MTGIDEQVVARLRDALGAGRLDEALAAAPPSVRPLLARLRDALAAPDPRAAVDALAADLATDPDLQGLAASLLASGAADAAKASASFAGAAEALRASSGEAEASRKALLDALSRGEVEGLSPADAETLRAALDAVKVGPLAGALGRLLGQADEVAEVVASTLKALAGSPGDVEAVVGPLRDVVQRLEGQVDAGAAREWATALRDLAGRLRAVAASRGVPRTARTALLEAALAEVDGMARRADPAATEPLWRGALDAAEREGDVAVATRAAARLQAAALDARDLEAVLALSRRVQALARAVGDARRDLLCRLEQAQALAQLRRFDEAEALLATTRVGAQREGAVDLVARAHLGLGDVLVARDEPAEALGAYEKAIATLEGTQGHEAVAARAALGLARALVDVPEQAERRGRALQVALEFGQALRDPRVIVPARLGLASDAAEHGDVASAVGQLLAGRREAESLGAPIGALTEYLGTLQERFGSEAVAAALRAQP